MKIHYPSYWLGWLAATIGMIAGMYFHDAKADSPIQLYNWYCMKCHGEKGYGDGPDAYCYSPRPRNLAKDPFVMGDSIQAIETTVKYGFNQMPPFDGLTNSERNAIAIYVKSMRKKE